MAHALAGRGDRPGERFDLRRLLHSGRRSKGSGKTVRRVTRREDQGSAAFHEDLGGRKAQFAIQIDVEDGQVEQPGLRQFGCAANVVRLGGHRMAKFLDHVGDHHPDHDLVFESSTRESIWGPEIPCGAIIRLELFCQAATPSMAPAVLVNAGPEALGYARGYFFFWKIAGRAWHPSAAADAHALPWPLGVVLANPAGIRAEDTIYRWESARSAGAWLYARLGNDRVPAHITAMVMPKILVHFACSDCQKMYVASQEHRPGTGFYDCPECGKQVHQWSGNYTLADWKPAAS